MLLNNFYEVKAKSATELDGRTTINAQVTINEAHPIFDGHFPSKPVVPGVCMVQIIKEILENHLVSQLFLASASNIKFLSVINPEKNKELHVEVTYTHNAGVYNVDAQLFFEQITFFKIKGILSTSL